jgi:ligand-binding sensor domain-containing protein
MFLIRIFSLQLILLVFAAIVATAQQPAHHNIGHKEGLSSNEIFDIFQDKRGFIWIGHNLGLSRFDGISFKHFENKLQAGRAFSFIQEDNNGRIWCSNFAGEIFFTENDSLKKLPSYKKENSFRYAETAYDSISKCLYAASGSGLFVHNTETGKSKYIMPEGESEFAVTTLKCNNKGEVVLINIKQQAYKYYKGKFELLADLNVKEKVSSYAAINICNANSYLFYCQNYKRFYKVSDKKIETFNSPFNAKINSFSIADGYTFANTVEGSYILEESDIGIKPFFIKENTSDVFKDAEGNFWLATLNNGIKLIANTEIQIFNYKNSLLLNDKLKRVINGEQNRIFAAGSEGVIYHINTLNNEILNTYFTSDKKPVYGLYFHAPSNTLYASSDNLYAIDIKSGKIKVCDQNPTYVRDLIFFDKFQLIGNTTGLFISDKQGTFNSISGENNTLLYSGVNHKILGGKGRVNKAHFQPGKNRIYAAYSSGLIAYAPEGVDTITFQGHNIYASYFFEYNNKLLTATFQNGIFVIENGAISRHITKSDGLLDDIIFAVKAHEDKIWILSKSGIQSCDTTFKNFNYYTKDDGIQIYGIADFSISNNRVWIAGGQGLQSFPMDMKSVNPIKPSIQLNKILVNGKEIMPTTNLFKPEENNFTFDFQSLTYKPSDNFKYEYRLLLNGAESQWINTDKENRIIRFFSLMPGNYHFQARAVNEDNNKSENIIHYEFEIDRPYYLKWQFIILCFVISVFAVALIAYFRIRYLQRKNKLLQEKKVIESELRKSQLIALKAQMNPHFVFNALNSIQEFIQTNEKIQANNYLGKFADLMRQYLNMSNKTEVSLEEEINALKLYLELEKIRFEDSLKVEISYDPALTEKEINFPPMLIQPLAENALKHGLLHKKTDRRLNISFAVNEADKILLAKVTDNGIGRKKSLELKQKRQIDHHVSFAISATQKRLELLNNGRNLKIGLKYTDPEDSAGNALGTIAEISIPYN